MHHIRILSHIRPLVKKTWIRMAAQNKKDSVRFMFSPNHPLEFILIKYKY